MKKHEHILKQLRVRLQPKDSAKSVDVMLSAIQKKLPQAVVMAGGSYAKGTSIKNNYDVDVFIKFPRPTLASTMVETIALAFPRAKRLHGSRDYFQVQHKGFVFELVPVLDIRDWREAENVTDMSPLHVEYVTNILTREHKDDVRLAKQFCKSGGVYGAESYIRGFSGYVLELLVGHYDGFENLLQAAADWKKQVVLDPNKHYTSPDAGLLRLNEAKTVSPLIIIDPLQPDRNAAAALSCEAFETFKARAKKFLEKPNIVFFDLKVSRSAIKKEWKGKHVLFITTKTPRGKQDVVGCKVRAKHDLAIQLFREHEFPLVYADWRFGEKQSVCWYVLDETKLPVLMEQAGPPTSMSSSVAAFAEKHPDAFERQGRWYAKVKRKYTTAQQVLKVAWNMKTPS